MAGSFSCSPKPRKRRPHCSPEFLPWETRTSRNRTCFLPDVSFSFSCSCLWCISRWPSCKSWKLSSDRASSPLFRLDTRQNFLPCSSSSGCSDLTSGSMLGKDELKCNSDKLPRFQVDYPSRSVLQRFHEVRFFPNLVGHRRSSSRHCLRTRRCFHWRLQEEMVDAFLIHYSNAFLRQKALFKLETLDCNN